LVKQAKQKKQQKKREKKKHIDTYRCVIGFDEFLVVLLE